jgi:hypothetical protein
MFTLQSPKFITVKIIAVTLACFKGNMVSTNVKKTNNPTPKSKSMHAGTTGAYCPYEKKYNKGNVTIHIIAIKILGK